MLNPIFRHSGLLTYALHSDTDMTMILTNSDSLSWAALRETKDGVFLRLHVIGPCMSYGLSAASREHARKMLTDSIEASEGYMQRVLHVLDTMSIVPLSVLQRYALMMALLLQNRKLTFQDIYYPLRETFIQEAHTARAEDYVREYRTEQRLLENIRRGELSHSDELHESGKLSGEMKYVTEPLGHEQIIGAILTSLCARAAMDGGVTPEEAYRIGDRYIQNHSRHIIFRRQSSSRKRCIRKW